MLRKVIAIDFILACLVVNGLGVDNCYAHGSTNERLHIMSHAIEDNPDDPEWWVKRGKVFQDSGSWDDAIDDFSMALKIEPKYNKALFWKGNALFKKGDYDQAIENLQLYLVAEIFSPSGNRLMAKSYFQLGEYLKAVRFFDLAIGNDKNPSPQVYVERVHNLLQISPIPFQRINSGLNEAINQQGEIVTFIELLVEVNIKAKDYPLALSWVEKLPENLLKSPQWLIKKAEIEVLQGHKSNALILYRQCLNYISSLPVYKQHLTAFSSAREKAKDAIARLQ